MRKLLAALFAASLGATACGQPPLSRHRSFLQVRQSFSSSSRSTSSPRTCSTNIAPNSRMASRGSRPVRRSATAIKPMRRPKLVPDIRPSSPADHPSRTGIIANVWIDQTVKRSDLSVYCVEDENAPGSSSVAYEVSPKHLLVPTLGELVKARWPGSRNVAVSGKDRAAVMMTGQSWTSAGIRWAKVPDRSCRSGGASGRRQGQCHNRRCASSATRGSRTAGFLPGEGAGDTDRGGRKAGRGRSVCSRGGDANAFRASPELDASTLALAAGLVDEMQLGRGASPDVLAISLSGTDYVGHAYGTEGEEMCLQLLELDRDMGASWPCSTVAESTMRSRSRPIMAEKIFRNGSGSPESVMRLERILD